MSPQTGSLYMATVETGQNPCKYEQTYARQRVSVVILSIKSTPTLMFEVLYSMSMPIVVTHTKLGLISLTIPMSSFVTVYM